MNQSEDIARIAVELVDRCLQDPATDEDMAIVERQLGRYPRGMVAVGARCVCGRPLAVITRPLLPGGIPFPTTCYLTGPEAVKAASLPSSCSRVSSSRPWIFRIQRSMIAGL